MAVKSDWSAGRTQRSSKVPGRPPFDKFSFVVKLKVFVSLCQGAVMITGSRLGMLTYNQL